MCGISNKKEKNNPNPQEDSIHIRIIESNLAEKIENPSKDLCF